MHIVTRWLVCSTVVLANVACGEDDDPAESPETLTVVTAEPPGDNCSAGGQAIHGGADTNRDGVLDFEEIASSSYVCNGAQGAPGHYAVPARPPEVLTSLRDEPPGENCTWAGKVLMVGRDDDADGVLVVGEVTSREYFCDAPAVTCYGSYAITTPKEFSEFVGLGCTHVTGNLTISGFDLPSFEGLVLESVAGSLTISRVGGITDLLGFDALQEIGDDLRLDANPDLVELTGARKRLYVYGEVEITSNPSLESVGSLGAWVLTTPGILDVSDNASLRQCEVDALAVKLGLECVACDGNTGVPNKCEVD